jgi:hypothetical protein
MICAKRYRQMAELRRDWPHSAAATSLGPNPASVRGLTLLRSVHFRETICGMQSTPKKGCQGLVSWRGLADLLPDPTDKIVHDTYLAGVHLPGSKWKPIASVPPKARLSLAGTA